MALVKHGRIDKKTGASSKSQVLTWRCHTPNFLKEIADHALTPTSGGKNHNGVLFQPLNIFRQLLIQVAERASELNDPILNKLMFDLTLYELPKPGTKEHSRLMKSIYKAAEEQRKKELKNKKHESNEKF